MSGWVRLSRQIAFVARHARQPWSEIMKLRSRDFQALLLNTARMIGPLDD